MNKINIVFIGCVQFSKTVLIELLNQNVNITGICTKKKIFLMQIFLIYQVWLKPKIFLIFFGKIIVIKKCTHGSKAKNLILYFV
tara:strand:- start:775 stop:1026 length:252 start_codon:yes stop_codon:yes gene_type:complete